MYLVGWDSHIEAYWTKFVLQNSFWDSTISNNNNAMLSLTLLAPTISLFLQIDTTWIFKAVYPLFLSLIPSGLYFIYKGIYKGQIKEKIAFLSCFFFVSVIPFFFDMVGLMKQIIASFFLMLLLLVATGEGFSGLRGKMLLIIFGASLVVSHYGTSYVLMICLLLSFIAFLALKSKRLINNTKREMLAPAFVTLYIVFALAWYIYIASSPCFVTIVNIGNNIFCNIMELFNAEKAQPLQLIVGGTRSWQHDVMKGLNILMQIFIVIGVTKEILNRMGKKSENFGNEYFAFSIGCLMIWIISVMVPYFSSGQSLDAKRLYYLTLFFLAPFGIVGGIEIFNSVSNFLVRIFHTTSFYITHPLKFVVIILILLLLFNTGFVDGITRSEYPLSTPLAWAGYDNSNLIEKVSLSQVYTKDQDVFAAKWLSGYRNTSINTFADYISQQQVLRSYGMLESAEIISKAPIWHNSYIYLRHLNVIDNTLLIGWQAEITNTTAISLFLKNKIYTNGGSEIYYYE